MGTVRDASADSLLPSVGSPVEPGSLGHTDGWLACVLLREKRATDIAWSSWGATASRRRICYLDAGYPLDSGGPKM